MFSFVFNERTYPACDVPICAESTIYFLQIFANNLKTKILTCHAQACWEDILSLHSWGQFNDLLLTFLWTGGESFRGHVSSEQMTLGLKQKVLTPFPGRVQTF